MLCLGAWMQDRQLHGAALSTCALLATPSPAAHDLYIVHENKVQHWNSLTQRTETVMDVSGGVTGAVAPGIGQVQLCTLCAR